MHSAMNCSTFHAGGKGHEDEVGFSPQPRSCGVRLPSVGEVERDEQTAATYHQAVVVAHKSNPPGLSGNLPVNTHTVVTYH